MIRVLWFFIGLVLIASAAAWLADRPGDIVVDWQGWRIETSVAAGAVAFAVLLAAGAIGYHAWLQLWHSPQAIGRWRRDGRRRKGETALFSGMTALAAGEGDEARKLGRRALALLDESPLALMLSAQAAQQAGDTLEAARLYNRMLGEPETEFLGVRGLLVQALQAGDTQAALRHARRAQALRPGSPWVQNLLFDLQSAAGLWHEAQATLEDASRHKVVDKATGRRRKALTLYAQARDADTAGGTDKAAALARDAHALAPDFVPAALLSARHYQANDETGKAARVIEACWRKSPHPDLAALYLALNPRDEAPRRVRRIARLDRLNAGHREGHVALAGVLANARRWHEAHTHLNKALAAREERRLFRLMAKVEEGEHGAAAAGSWLQKMAAAPADDAWVCGGCGAVASAWTPHCDACGRFDSLAWGPPPRPHTGAPAGALPAAASEPMTETEGGGDGGAGSPAALARLSEAVPEDDAPSPALPAVRPESQREVQSVAQDTGSSLAPAAGSEIVDASPPKA